MAETKPLIPKTSILSSLTAPLFSLLAALGVGAVFIAATGRNPVAAYAALLNGAFGNSYRIAETLVAATPLTIMALGIIIAFKASVFNVGGPGQEHMGAIMSTWVGVYLTLPSFIHLPLVIITGFVGGALWALLPAVLKAKYHINEIVVTIMMNYLAINIVGFLVSGPMLEPGAWIPWTSQLQVTARLPLIVGRLHADFLIALVAIPLVYIFLSKTVLGYKLRVVGANPKAAKYAGINITRSVMLSMILSGGLIGLAGMGEIAGVFLRVQEGFSPGYGYTCIPVALLAKLNPLAVLPAAIIFGMLYSGGLAMKAIGVPTAITDVIQGTVLIFLLASELITRRRK
jgi:general nucleoside transport system permease protein